EPGPLGFALAEQRVEHVAVHEREPRATRVEATVGLHQDDLRDAQLDGDGGHVVGIGGGDLPGDAQDAEAPAPDALPDERAQRLAVPRVAGAELDGEHRRRIASPALRPPGASMTFDRLQKPSLGAAPAGGPPHDDARAVPYQL